MAILFNNNAPAGWGVTETGHLAKVPDGYVLRGNEYVPGGSDTNPQYGNITLPSGQVISTADPNYSTYASQAQQGYGTFQDDNPHSSMTTVWKRLPDGRIDVQQVDKAAVPMWTRPVPPGTDPATWGSAYTVGTPPTSSQAAANWPGQQMTETTTTPPKPLYTKSGIDMSGWPEEWKTLYTAMEDFTNSAKLQGKVVNPNITIDQSVLDRFRAQAVSEMAPYYGEVLTQAQDSFQNALDQIRGNYATGVRDIGVDYAKNLEATQENYARRGLEFSSSREKAEQDVAAATQRRLDDLMTTTERAGLSAGRQAESQLGSTDLANRGYNTTVLAGARPITGMPGVYGMTTPDTSRSLFSTLGNITGEITRSKLYDTESRTAGLVANERNLRALNYL